MLIRTAGTWIAGLALGFAALPATIIGSAKGTDGLMLIGPSIIAMVFAAVVAAYVAGLTFVPPLWKGESDEVGHLFVKSTSGMLMGVAFLAMIGGAITIIPAVAATLSGM